MTNAKAVLALLAVLSLALGSCSSTTGPSGPGPPTPVIPMRTVAGTVVLPEGASLDLATLEVISFGGRGQVSTDGVFSLEVPDTDLPQALLVMGEGTSPVLLGYVGPDDVNDVVVDASTTALALVMLNPFTAMFSAADRVTLADMVRSKDWWPELVEWAEDVVGRSGTGRLDQRLEPGLMQLAVEIAIDVLDDWPAGPLSTGDPWLEDLEGDDVSYVNPDVFFYAARFRAIGSDDSLLVLVDSDRERICVTPGWPPFVDMLSYTHTTVDLGDGTFNVTITHGDLGDFDPGTAGGLAGARNVARAVTEVLALASGVTLEPEPAGLELESLFDGTALAAEMQSDDTYGFMEALIDVIIEENDRVSTWLWEEENPDAEDYLSGICPLLEGIVFSTQVLAAGETRIPFFGSLVAKGALDSQRIAQLDGVLVMADSYSPPEAAFEVSPSFASVGNPVSFDASGSTDPDDPPGALGVRWDWENDGVWDTGWSVVKTAQHSFAAPRAYEVALQVRDGRLLNDSVVHTINVGGSEENATHIVIFRDAVPWEDELPPILDQMLEVMEFTVGPGPDQYQVVSSAEMDTFLLTPGEDLVIIQSDQPQSFYDEYAANQVRFMQFVSLGGTMLWAACDLGWHGGSIGTAGIVLPGAVVLEPYETWYNYVSLPGAPIVEGLPSLLYGQYASHAGIGNLPDGATVYVVDDAEQPTLVEYDYGSGWVIMTTEPLEWNFYHNWTAGGVMPHVVSYVLGIPLVHDFGDIVKPDLRGRPRSSGGARDLTSGIH